MEYYTLNNGVKIPKIGFGVFQIPEDKTEEAVLAAIKAGYRCIDTAAAYNNEEAVGRAIKKCGVPRDQLFIITKLWVQDFGYENAKKAFEVSLKKLDLEYVDCYLMHQMVGDVYGTWRALEELYDQKKVRAIGVANGFAYRVVDLCMNCRIKPAIDQIEIHPFFQREEDVKYLKEYGVLPQAWGPFAEGGHGIFTHPVLTKIGKKYNKTAAQVALRWSLQRGIQIIPKSVHEDRIKQNFDVFNFELSADDMKEIEALDTGKTDIINHHDPQVVKFLNSFKIHD